MRAYCLSIIVVWSLVVGGLSDAFAAEAEQAEKRLSCTLRIGQGGFQDSRSPLGKLGGGQMALDLKLRLFPLALSVSSEYYTNSPDPSHPYEIADMTVVNLLYMTRVFDFERATLFAGGGLGRLNVPQGEDDSDAMVRGTVYNLEAGLKVRVFWKIGVYGVGKYLYAQKKVDGVNVIDFNEWAGLLGLSVTVDF